MPRRWHCDDITTCCPKLKIEKYALKNTPRMSMFILVVFSWRRRPACRLHAGRRRRCAGRRPRDAGRRRRECARVFQWRRLHFKRNAGCMQAACRASTPRKYTENELTTCMQAACMLLQPATSCIPSYAGCMQAACSLHASLVWHWLYGD